MPTRRSVMQTAMAAGLAPISPAGAAEPALPNKMALYARTRGAGDDRGLIWYTGTLWAKRSFDAAVPLFHVDGCSFNRVTMGADGRVSQSMIEVGFWCTPGTHDPADKWINPLNGLPCSPRHYKSRQALTFAPDGHGERPAGLPDGMMYESIVTDPVVSGDTVWIGENIITKMVGPAGNAADPLENGPAVRAQTSLVTYTVKRKDLAGSAKAWLPATMNYQTMGGWYPWMRMGQEPGQLMFQLVGRKLKAADELPAALVRLIDERHPGWLKDPGI